MSVALFQCRGCVPGTLWKRISHVYVADQQLVLVLQRMQYGAWVLDFFWMKVFEELHFVTQCKSQSIKAGLEVWHH